MHASVANVPSIAALGREESSVQVLQMFPSLQQPRKDHCFGTASDTAWEGFLDQDTGKRVIALLGVEVLGDEAGGGEEKRLPPLLVNTGPGRWSTIKVARLHWA